MASKNSTTSGGGIGFVGLLTIVFIVLKVVHFKGNTVNSWSWWWVLSPVLISGCVVILCLLVGFAILVAKELRRG